MSPEIERAEYFTNFESKVLPKITWQEMMEKNVVISPEKALEALKEAYELLTTAPGPNLERRKVLAVGWFNYWQDLLVRFSRCPCGDLVDSGAKLVGFKNLSGFLKDKYGGINTGMLFVAGAEGHEGHVHAAKYMSEMVPVTIWGFEQPEYMKTKERRANFLPLELRLSMWACMPNISHLTVLPLNTSGISDSEHYNDLFKMSGVMYFFAHEKDPNLSEKLLRGKQDLPKEVRTIPDLPTVRTTDRVKRLIPDLTLNEEDSFTEFLSMVDTLGFHDSMFIE